jgi:predicted ATPase/DNA-binding CsgD family transcriptional regulator
MSAIAGTGHLPAEVAPIVGRRRELALLREILVETRLLTLTGVGGVGKSRLALGVGRGLEHQHGGGAWMVELAAVRDPRLVASAVARSLGVEEKGGEELYVSIARRLGPGPSLLLLDNCEHVLDAAAELAHSLLERCSELRVLATSRQALGIEGEATFLVPPLAVPNPDLPVATPQQALGFGAIQMFSARAFAADPDFTLTELNMPVVIDICRRLEGIPLGLELAAVRVRTLSLTDLRDRLDDQLSLPNLNVRSASARHHTLAATLDWSYDLLSEHEQLLLHRLSVFSGGFTADGAASVCADESLVADAVIDVLASLVEKSLVVVDRRPTTVRYRLLEPVRLYGLDHLRAAGVEKQFREAHLRWCLEWTENLGQWHAGLRPCQARRVADESGNLFAALEVSLSEETHLEYGFALIDHIARVWLIGWPRELAHYGGLLLERVSRPLHTRARVFYATGRAAWRLGDHQEAQGHFHNCLAGAGRRRGFELERGLGLLGLGFAAVWNGESSEAISVLPQAVELIDPAVASVMHVEATLWLACTSIQDERDFPTARALIERAIEFDQQNPDNSNRGLAHWLLGEIDLREGQLASAEANFESSLRARHEIGHRVGVAYAMQGLAFTAHRAGRNTRAAELMGGADAMAESLGHALLQLPGTSRTEWENTLRANLGQRRFSDTYDAGRAHAFTDALALALGDTPTLKNAPVRNDTLTRRESEIARLIATGATNRRIANKLAISDQTVKFHVHNILSKLSFESRAEIAAWQTRRQTS